MGLEKEQANAQEKEASRRISFLVKELTKARAVESPGELLAEFQKDYEMLSNGDFQKRKKPNSICGSLASS